MSKIIMTMENMKMNELHEIIETAVRLDKSIALEEWAVGKIHLQMINATRFFVDDLYWKKGNEVYQAVVEIQYRKRDLLPGLYVIGNISSNGFYSGKTNLFTRNNRYTVS